MKGFPVRLKLFVIHPWRFCVCVSGHMTTYRNDTKTGLETQSILISYDLFWEVGGVSRRSLQSSDLMCCFLCVGVDRTADVSTRLLGSECSLRGHVWIDFRTSVKDTRCLVGFLVDILLDCRLAVQGYLVSLQSFVIQPWRFCVCVSGHMTTYRNDTKTGLETQSTLMSYDLFWEVG